MIWESIATGMTLIGIFPFLMLLALTAPAIPGRGPGVHHGGQGCQNQLVYGLPNLSEKDCSKVIAANVMLRRAVNVIRRCLRLGLAGYLENPASSMIWQTPEILHLLKDSRVQLIRLDMCMYHTQWKKPTKLLVWNVSKADFQTCQGRKLCSRTGKAHVQLTGFTGKRFATEQAQVYSHAFSAHLMQSLFS